MRDCVGNTLLIVPAIFFFFTAKKLRSARTVGVIRIFGEIEMAQIFLLIFNHYCY